MKEDYSGWYAGFGIWGLVWFTLIMPSDAGPLFKMITNPLIAMLVFSIVGIVFFDWWEKK